MLQSNIDFATQNVGNNEPIYCFVLETKNGIATPSIIMPLSFVSAIPSTLFAENPTMNIAIITPSGAESIDIIIDLPALVLVSENRSRTATEYITESTAGKTNLDSK